MALTDKFLRGDVEPGKFFDDHRDAPRGFGVKVHPSGRKVFILRYKVEGRERQLTIGAYPTWSLAAARAEAKEYKRKADRGQDVILQRKVARTEPTLADLVDRYCRAHADKLKSGKLVRSSLKRDLGPILKRKAKAIRRADLIEIVERKAEKTPRAAALLLVYLKGLFSWAVHREILENSPAAVIKPSRVSAALKPRNRGRVLTDDEIRAFWTNVETCGIDRLTAIALKMILVTGQRPGEVAGMRKGEIDGPIWVIPAERRGKSEAAQTVPLTDTALELIEAAKAEAARREKRRGWTSDYLFATREDSHLGTASIGRAVRRYVDELGNLDAETWGHWTPHDLRRTCRTGLAACNIPEEIAERVIGHGKRGIVAVYNLHEYDAEKRRALKAWERHLQKIIAGESDQKVVSLGVA